MALTRQGPMTDLKERLDAVLEGLTPHQRVVALLRLAGADDTQVRDLVGYSSTKSVSSRVLGGVRRLGYKNWAELIASLMWPEVKDALVEHQALLSPKARRLLLKPDAVEDRCTENEGDQENQPTPQRALHTPKPPADKGGVDDEVVEPSEGSPSSDSTALSEVERHDVASLLEVEQ